MVLADRDDDEVMEVWFEEFRTILSRYTIYRSWIVESVRGSLDCRSSTCNMSLEVHGGYHLCQNLWNHMPMHIGQATLDSVVVIGQQGVVDAK